MIVTLGVYNNTYSKMIAIYYTTDLRHVMAKEVRCMKKIKLIAVLTVIISMLFSVNSFAAVYNGEPDVITITGGIDMSREYESTFNESRRITGTAQSGTKIMIMLCEENEENVLTPVKTYETTVGVSGYFSKNISLDIGENIIVVQTADGRASVSAVIKRKSTDIKDKLERGVYMPGARI